MLWTSLVGLAGPAMAAPTWTEMAGSSAWIQFKEASTESAGPVALLSARISGIECFKAEARVSGPSPTTLLGVATDIAGAVHWSRAGLKEGKVLKGEGSTLDYYQYLHVPVISDRFWFLHGTLLNEGGLVGLRWEKTWEGGGPYAADWQAVKAAHPDSVEPPVNLGAWFFRAEGSQVEISYLICSDVGGSIPEFVQSKATRETLPGTVDDLVKEGLRRKQ